MYPNDAGSASTVFLAMREITPLTGFHAFNVKFIRNMRISGPDGLKIPYMVYFQHTESIKTKGNGHPPMFFAPSSHSKPKLPCPPHTLSAPPHPCRHHIIALRQEGTLRRRFASYHPCIFMQNHS